MRRLRSFLLYAGLLAATAAVVVPLNAQVTRADSAAVLLDAARRLQLEGENSASNELLAFILRHYGGTPAALEAASFYSDSRAMQTQRSGRASLIGFSTLYGAWLGVAVPAAFGADEPEPYGAGLLIGGPLGFLAAKAFADRHPMSSGQATLTGFGARWGTWQGIGWREVLEIGTRTVEYCYSERDCYSYEDDPEEAPFTAGIVGGLTGLITAGVVAQRIEPSHGAATMVELGAGWGVWYGLAGSALVDPDMDGDGIITWALMGGNVGLVASALATRTWKMGAGRARIISAAGLAGGVAGLGIDLLASVDDERTAILIPTVTSAIGLVAGASMTTHYDSGTPDPDESDASLGLVNLRSGRWTVGLPALQPTLLVRPDLPRGSVPTLGAKVAVFSAEF